MLAAIIGWLGEILGGVFSAPLARLVHRIRGTDDSAVRDNP